MKLSDIPDSVLASMVRDGCYTKGESIGGCGGKFLLVFAVTYGAEEVETLNEAFEAFHDFHSDEDWMRRNIQVLTVEDGQVEVLETSAEVLED